ncbi:MULTISPECIES: DUF1796 family putative cysteine peptidase [Paenibacillus]|uniref:Peptidase n=1 Tax=Paenibacillus borealis TaxID=160799 RepID=A0ABX3HLM1_PAEBO|nr:DUF1796 family putative cysteine peptidase [Paenibacillus borealis]OMD50730.1 hypothetical protein BSK56_06065 [Paenibacillus borealis]
MRFEEIKGAYDCIVCLGSSCEPAAHLRRRGLRTFSSPLDWVVSLSHTDVNLLLSRRFPEYMELPNEVPDEGDDVFVENEVVMPVRSYFIKDYYYYVISVHDFPILEEQEWGSVYPGFKDKIDMRSQRLLDQLIVSRKVLFIRWGSTYEESLQLQKVLGSLTLGTFHILIVNGVDGLESVTDNEWGLPGISSLSIPNRTGDNETWDYILEGVSLE